MERKIRVKNTSFQEKSDLKNHNSRNLGNSSVIQCVNPAKKKKSMKEDTGNESAVIVQAGLSEKKLKFSVSGELTQLDSNLKAGVDVSKEKKTKVRKPRWSEERKLEERKRKAELPPTEHIDHQPKKRKKPRKKFKLTTVDNKSVSSTSALQYLQHWRYDRGSWKFSKTKQTWLLKHIFDLNKIPSSLFPILVEYISTCKGGARLKTYEAAGKIIQKLEGKASTGLSECDEEEEIKKCLEGEESEKDNEEIHQRARAIMQELSDCT